MKNSKFDMDLQFGQAGENWLRWLGTDQARVEVKTERDTWVTTGNAVFEYECRGKPSGVAVTESDIWIHLFAVKRHIVLGYIIPVPALKSFLRYCYTHPVENNCRITTGGDDNASKVILVPIERLSNVTRH